jgi:EAL domain-containing protein (putative c-di-GMP-specific phosphodiesterase class I)
MGLHLAIDDFGTGYSSLSALQQFPLNTLKIDQSFVRDLGLDRDNAAIVKTVIQMARSLNLDVVAEGVENQEQLDFLRLNGCDIVQGHLFGDPMPAGEFCDLMIADAEGSGRYRALFA